MMDGLIVRCKRIVRENPRRNLAWLQSQLQLQFLHRDYLQIRGATYGSFSGSGAPIEQSSILLEILGTMGLSYTVGANAHEMPEDFVQL